MSEDAGSRLTFRVGRSVLRIDGSVTTSVDPITGEHERAATAEVTLGVEADPDPEVRFALDLGTNDVAHGREFAIQLADDGRLTGVTGTSSGSGAALVEAGVRLGTFVVTAAAGIARTALAVRGGGVSAFMPPAKGAALVRVLEEHADAPRGYAADHPDEAARRDELRTALLTLQTRLAELAGAAGGAGEDPAAALAAVQGALAAVRAEAAGLETHRDAWIAARTVVEEHHVVVPLADVPRDEELPAELGYALADLHRGMRRATETLGVLVVATRGTDEQRATSTADTRTGRPLFRVPRRVTLAVYEAQDPGAATVTFRRRRVTPAWVLDAACAIDGVDLRAGIMEKRSATLAFGATGALAELKSTNSAAADELAKALGAAGGQADEALEAGGKAAAGVAALRRLGGDERVAALAARQKQLEAEIALKGVLATREDRERLAELKAQADRVAAEQALAALEAPGAPAPRP